MRVARIALLLTVVGCSTTEKAPEATPAAEPAVAPAPAPPPAFSLADAAGTWTYVAKTPTGDTVLVTGELNATADGTGWTMVFPGAGNKPIPMTVTVSGDSLITKAGPYPSVLRKGVTVTTEGALRMSDGKMIGRSVAHYSVKTADSVRALITEATRKP